jgi:hypothetical protein
MGPRPTFKELKRCLEDEHGCSIAEVPIFPGLDNEDGSKVKKLFNRGKTQWMVLPELDDDEEVSPSQMENICRRLGIDPKDLLIACGDGHVSLKTPVPPLVN